MNGPGSVKAEMQSRRDRAALFSKADGRGIRDNIALSCVIDSMTSLFLAMQGPINTVIAPGCSARIKRATADIGETVKPY